jgi:signal transduction histidine kinase
MRKFVVTAFMIASFSAGVKAQTEINKDSLMQITHRAKADTNTINACLAMADFFLEDKQDSALYYTSIAGNLADKISATSHRYRLNYEFARIFHRQRDYKKAIEYTLANIVLSRKDGNRSQEAFSYRNLFTLYHSINKNDSALKYAQYAMKLTEEINDTFKIAMNYGNLCRLYEDITMYDSAIVYGKKGIAAGEKYHDKLGLLISLNNIAIAYMRQGNYNEALPYLSKQLAEAKLFKRARSIRLALENLANVYFNLGNTSGLIEATAQLNAFNSTDSSWKTNDRAVQFIANGNSNFLQKKFSDAESNYLKALDIAKNDVSTDEVLTAYTQLSQLKFAEQEFKAGLNYGRLADSVSNLINTTELTHNAADLEAYYQSQKKDNQIQLQQADIKQKNIINYIISGIAVSLTIISFLFYWNYRHKQTINQQRIAELEIEKKLAATEAVLQGEEKERTRIAKDLHDGLSGMLSGVKFSLQNMQGNLVMTSENQLSFARSLDMLDNSITEMRRVAHNMLPEGLVRYGLDVALKDYVTEINTTGIVTVVYQSMGLADGKISQAAAISIYRIIQELLNNVIRHAAAKNVLVQVLKEEGRLIINVEDNGKGFDTTVVENTAGIGWKNIRSRVELLNGKIDIQSAAGKGTEVNIEMNLV